MEKKILINMVRLIIPFVLVILIELLHRGSFLEVVEWISNDAYMFLYTGLILLAFMNILSILIKGNRVLIIVQAFIVLAYLLLAYISQVKINLRGEPLSIIDYKLITEAIGVIKGFEINYIIPIFLLMGTVLLSILFWKTVKGIQDKITKCVYSIVSLLIIILFFSLEIEELSKLNISVPADVSFNHEENGFILASVIDTKFLSIPKPETYSKESIANIVDEMEQYTTEIKSTNQENFQRPNVIFVMSESFSTPNTMLGIQTNEQVTPNFDYYASQAVSGTVEVPGIGGGTANTEFEVLTGLSKDYIPNYTAPYNAYNTYINNNTYSLATEFAQQNYATLALHTYYSWFYKRNSVYKYLGFEKFLPVEFLNQQEVTGNFVDDKIINEEIIKQVNQTDERDFIYAITMAAHGPYDTKFSDKVKITENLSDKETIENYLNAIHLSDARLGDLIEYFSDYDEPTVIVFFGDHIPPLGEVFYSEIGFNMQDVQSKQAPLLIWKNYGNEKRSVEVSANFLGPLVLEEINYLESEYFNYLSNHNEKSDDQQYLNQLYQLQYDLLHGKRYFYDKREEYVNDRYELGNPIYLEKLVMNQFNQFTAIEISGENLISNLSLNLGGDVYPLEVVNDKKAYLYIEDDISMSNNASLLLTDTRETIIKRSNDIKPREFVYSEKGLFEGWYSVKLDGQQYWETFDVKDDYVITRLKLKEYDGVGERPYFVLKDGHRLSDVNADMMTASLQSDIYVNGYLYLSIPMSSNSEDIGIENIKEHFNEEEYILYTVN